MSTSVFINNGAGVQIADNYSSITIGGGKVRIEAPKKSPLQIVEAVEREFRAEMNPYCLSVGERATLEAIGRIKADLREGGWG